MPVDGAELRRQQEALTALVERDLTAFWRSLPSTPEKVRDALLAFVPDLVRAYGESAASIAADWFDEQRALSGARGRFAAITAEAVDEAIMAAQVRFGAGHLWTDDPGATLTFLLGSVDKYVLQPARETVRLSSLRDPSAAGWARQTAGGCDFCQMLAGRGAVYSEASVDFEAHGHCHCIAVPVWDL